MTALFNLHVGDYLAFRIKILARTNYFLLNVVLFRMKLKDSKLTCQKSCIEESVLHLLLELECQTYMIFENKIPMHNPQTILISNILQQFVRNNCLTDGKVCHTFELI